MLFRSPDLTFQTGDVTALALPALDPAPFLPNPDVLQAWAEGLGGQFDTFWLSDGLARDSRRSEERRVGREGWGGGGGWGWGWGGDGGVGFVVGVFFGVCVFCCCARELKNYRSILGCRYRGQE